MVLALVLGGSGCGIPQPPGAGATAEGPDTGSALTQDTGPTDGPGCSEASGHAITPGIGIGPAVIGESYWGFVDSYGHPDAVIAYQRVFFATWYSLGLELVIASSDDAEPSLDSVVISVGTKAFDGFSGPVVPGMDRAEVQAVLGTSPEPVDATHFYPRGAGVVYGLDDTVMQITVFPAYSTRSEPPEMLAAGEIP